DLNAEAMVYPSQGAHIVLDKSFLCGDHAIIVPRTSDGRVLFAIPWHEHTLVGTTDTPVEQPTVGCTQGPSRGTSQPGTGADGTRNRLHAQYGEPVPCEETDEGRHIEHVRGNTAAVALWRQEKFGVSFARSFHSD